MEQTNQKKSGGNFWGWMLLLGAIVLLIVGGYPLAKQIVLDTVGVETTGTVIDVVGADRTKAPVVQFTTADGQEIEFKSGLATNFISFSKGEEVKVRYLESMPRIAEVTSLGRVSYFTDVVPACLGVFLLMGGLVALRNKPLVLDFSKKNS